MLQQLPLATSPSSPERDNEFVLAAERLGRHHLDPVDLMVDAGLKPDEWQVEFLRSPASRRLLCVTRQGGKSSVVAADALSQTLKRPRSTTLIVSPGQRQSGEVMEKVRLLLSGMRVPPAVVGESVLSLRLTNGSRILALPGKEATIRSYAADLLILDEAARIPDELYHAVTPMLAVTHGRLVALSTPWGRQGWFYEAWAGVGTWDKVTVTADECPRIAPEWLAEEKETTPEIIFRTEYMCEFTDLAGSVFSGGDIEAALAAGAEVATL